MGGSPSPVEVDGIKNGINSHVDACPFVRGVACGRAARCPYHLDTGVVQAWHGTQSPQSHASMPCPIHSHRLLFAACKGEWMRFHRISLKQDDVASLWHRVAHEVASRENADFTTGCTSQPRSDYSSSSSTVRLYGLCPRSQHVVQGAAGAATHARHLAADVAVRSMQQLLVVLLLVPVRLRQRTLQRAGRPAYREGGAGRGGGSGTARDAVVIVIGKVGFSNDPTPCHAIMGKKLYPTVCVPHAAPL